MLYGISPALSGFSGVGGFRRMSPGFMSQMGPGAGDGTSWSPEMQEEGLGAPPQQMMALGLMLGALMQGGGNPMAEMLLGKMLQQMLGGGNSPFGGSGSPSGGAIPGSIPGGYSGSPGGGGDSGSFGGASPSSNSGAPIQGTGNPSQAVQIAESHMGQAADQVNMPNYTHAGGVTNDCADFVSGCIADAGDFKKSAGDANVGQFQQDLQAQGWTKTTNPQPGDVAIVNGSQHAELVSGPNGQCVGANGSSSQSISNDTPSSWGSVVYWAPPGH